MQVRSPLADSHATGQLVTSRGASSAGRTTPNRDTDDLAEVTLRATAIHLRQISDTTLARRECDYAVSRADPWHSDRWASGGTACHADRAAGAERLDEG